MQKIRRKLLIGILTAAIVLSATQTIVWSETDTATEPVAADESPADTAEDAPAEEEEEEHVTEEQAMADMKLYASTSKLELYVNEETCAMALKNLENGYIWWSSPFDADNDALAKNAQKKTMKSPFFWESGEPESHRSTKVTAFDGAIKGKDFVIDKIENGIKFTFNFEKQATIIVMNVTLNAADNTLDVNIPTQDITELMTDVSSGSEILTLSLLPSFGAATTSENGYIFVPDGSGAIINFNNKKTSSAEYTGKVYGKDLSKGQLLAPAKTEQVYLPIYGMVKQGESGDNALLAVVDEGDSYATVKANVSGQSATSYNSVWFEFQLRATDTFYMGSNNRELNVYEAGNVKIGDVTVKYYPLAGDSLSYTDLADTYRSYLENKKGLTEKAVANSAPFYLTLYGGTVKTQSIAGFPVDLETAATTYSEAEEILNLLNTNGVDNIIVTYNDFNTAGIVSKVSPTVEYSGMLGGKTGYQKLTATASSLNTTIYPSFGFMQFYNSGNGYSFTLNSSKQITKAYATQTPFELAFGTPSNIKDYSTILSPYYFSDIFTKLIKSINEEGITTISLDEATYRVYSDYSRYNEAAGRDYFVRGDAQKVIETGLQRFKDNGTKILAQCANAYALPYVDELTDVPMYSSNYDIFDYDVPFYEILVHGVIPYTTKSINSSADADELVMLALCTGTPIGYDMIHENPNKFTDSNYDGLFYSFYEGWISEASSQYKLFKDVVSAVSDKKVVNHTRISKSEYETEFEGGTKIYVDTINDIVKVNGTEYKLADYGLGGGVTIDE